MTSKTTTRQSLESEINEILENAFFPQEQMRDDVAEQAKAKTALLKTVDAYVEERERLAREDEHSKCFDNVGGEDIRVRAWVAQRKKALRQQVKGGE